MWETLTKRAEGVVGNLEFEPVQYCILAACSALAWAYCFEITLLAFYTFRRWSGLYFYSLLICAWGCSGHALGFVLKFMTTTHSGAFLPFIEIGTFDPADHRMHSVKHTLTVPQAGWQW